MTISARDLGEIADAIDEAVHETNGLAEILFMYSDYPDDIKDSMLVLANSARRQSNSLCSLREKVREIAGKGAAAVAG